MRTFPVLLAFVALTACGGSNDNTTPAPQVSERPDQKASAKGVDVTLTRVQATTQIGDEGILPPAGDGEIYIVALYSITNTGTKPLDYVNRPAIDLVDAKGQVYAQDVVTSAFVATQADQAGFASSTNPGTTTKMGAVWKIAKKGFNPDTWKLVLRTKPKHEFTLT